MCAYAPTLRRTRWLAPVLLLALLSTAGLSLLLGGTRIAPDEAIAALARGIKGQAAMTVTDRILLEVRVPRVLMAAAVGAVLALMGLAAQTMFRNPLATPSILGISNGAALGMVAGLLLAGRVGFEASRVAPLFSIIGGLLVTLLVHAWGQRGRYFGPTLLLAGVAIASLTSALTTGALYLAGERLPAIVFWLMGGLWQATGRDARVMLAVAGGAYLLLRLQAPALNVALVGERSAHDLGLDLPRLQRRLLLLMAIATSIAVSLTGVIGFVGLVAPHLLRLATGSDHRRLVTATALGGALLLTLADTLARTLAAPVEIPVGILTALVGAPVFLFLLARRTGGPNP